MAMDNALKALLSGDEETFQKAVQTEDLTLDEAELPQPEPEVNEEVDEAEPELEAPETSEVEEDVSEPQTDEVVEAEAQETEVAPQLPDTEVISITDAKGKRDVTIDYTNRAKTKKAYEFAAGFRKMQAERDSVTSKLAEVEKSYSKLEELWGEGGATGIRNVVNQLSGGEEGFNKFIKAEIDERTRIANMSPEEKSGWERERAEEARRIEWETKMSDLSAKEQAHIQQQAEREEAQFKSHADSALSKFNFDGRFGNEKAEDMWNKTLWNNALDMLDRNTPEGQTPSAANFLKAFEISHSNLSSTIRTNVEKNVNSRIEKTKASAAKSAAKIARRGMAPKTTSAQELEEMSDRGDHSSVIQKIFGSNKKMF